jgi:hypothetical protein
MTDSDDRAALYEALKRDTVVMLGFDEPLSGKQQLTVDLATALRHAIDEIAAQQIAGVTIDVKQLASIVQALHSLFPAAAGGVADDHTARERDNEAAREKLDRIIRGVIMHKEHDLTETLLREEMVAIQASATSSQEVPLSISPPPATASASAQAPSAPPTPAPSAPPPETPTERYARVNGGNPTPPTPRPPENQDWRGFIDGSGNIKTGAGIGALKRDWGPHRDW